MKKLTVLIFISTLLYIYASAAVAEQLVTSFSGSSSAKTERFKVHAPWIVEWLVDGDPTRWEAIEVSLIDASTGESQGAVLQREAAGSGVKLFDQSGVFYFEVDSTMFNWEIKVKQLSKEEAASYSPASNSILDK